MRTYTRAETNMIRATLARAAKAGRFEPDGTTIRDVTGVLVEHAAGLRIDARNPGLTCPHQTRLRELAERYERIGEKVRDIGVPFELAFVDV